MSKKNNRITSKDVAKLAGVSVSTVSLVINGKTLGRVSDTLQKRVTDAIKCLNYVPSKFAQSLKRGSSDTIAILIPDISNPFFTDVIRGAQNRAKAMKYEVTFVEMIENPEWLNWLVKSVQTGMVEGAIIYLADTLDHDLLSPVSNRIVLIETLIDGIPSINIGVEKATESAVRHLIELGHESIGYVIADYDKETFHLRYKVFESLMREKNHVICPSHVVRARFSMKDSLLAAKNILTASPRPTAIFCDDDILAAGVYNAARSLQIKIPQDLSVVGFNDVEIARYLEPGLSTIRIPGREIGSEAMGLMINILQGVKPSVKQIPLSLILRGSTAPPPKTLIT